MPLGILLSVKLVPADLMVEFRAAASQERRPLGRVGAAAIIALWGVAAATLIWWFWPLSSV